MIKLLKGALVCSPFIHFLFIGKPILTSQALLSICFELAVILFFLIGTRKREPDLKSSMLFFAYIIASSLYLIGYGLLNVKGLNSVFFPLIHVSVFMLFYSAACYIVDKDLYHKLSRVIIYPAIILSLYAFFQYFKIDMFKFDGAWLDGTLGNPTNNAMYLTACLPFVFIHKRPLIPALVILTAIVAFDSASALIGALVILLIYFTAKKKYIRLAFLVIPLIIATILFHDRVKDFLYPYEKLQAWGIAIDSWKGNYIFGRGLDTFKNLNVVMNYSKWFFTHNHYIWILHSLGLAGLVLFFNWMRSLKFIFNPTDIRFIATLSLIGVAVMACASVPMRVYPIVLITGFNLAILTKEKE
jgi:hypothetical protein